jgi:hypothetical protein
MHEDYVNLVGDIMYPKSTFHYAESNPAEGKVRTMSMLYEFLSHWMLQYLCLQFPLEKINTLGYLVNPLRKRSVLGIYYAVRNAKSDHNLLLYYYYFMLCTQKNGIRMK